MPYVQTIKYTGINTNRSGDLTAIDKTTDAITATINAIPLAICPLYICPKPGSIVDITAACPGFLNSGDMVAIFTVLVPHSGQ